MDYDKYDLPILDIGKQCGDTDYIDFLRINDVNKGSAMKGIDCYKRHFIVIKMVAVNLETKEKQFIMETYFQRFTGYDTWHSCGHATKRLLFTNGPGLIRDQIDFLDKILNNYKYLLNKDNMDSLRHNFTANHAIALEDYWEKN